MSRFWSRKSVRDLEQQLEQARRERQLVAQEGRARQPMLQRLEDRLAENSFADLLVANLNSTRRRPT